MDDPQDGDNLHRDETDRRFDCDRDFVLADDVVSDSSEHETTNRIVQNETRKPNPPEPRPIVTRKPREAYDTPEKQRQRAKAMSGNTKKEPMEKPKQVVFDPVGTDSEELIAEISGDPFDNPGPIMTTEQIMGYNNSLDDDEKRSEDESPVATGTSESGMDAVIPPSTKAVNADCNYNDGDDNNKRSSGNTVFNSATRIRNLEEEPGISDGLDNAGIIIEMSADHGSSKRENANSFSLANVLGHSRRHSLRNIPMRSVGNTNYQNSDEKFSEDSYSFIALNGPEKNCSWSRERLVFFLFGFLPFVFQMVFLGLLLYSQTNELRGTIGETDNPDNQKEGIGTMSLLASFIPANSTPIIRWAQVTSLASFVIFPDASLQDIMRSIRLFPRSSEGESDNQFRCVALSCFLRFIQGIAAMIVTVLLVLTSNTVVDIILNFTAVNFISDLDEYAFSLAKTGEFSPTFQDEAERIAKTVLPRCMLRGKEFKWKCKKIVGGLVSMILLGTLIFVFYSQNSHKFWVTGILRVQLQDSELNEYSGCFGINTESSSMNFSRRTYHSLETGSTNSNTSFGYCRKDRQWVLFKGKADPCDARNRSDLALAVSPKTDAFDISTVFDESWVNPSNTPIDLYFFDGKNETKIEEECKNILGNGICDKVFNIGSYGYDDGDCCAATCTKSNCGRGGLADVFGDSDVSGDGFEDCVDPNMYPITIQLNDMTSSRDRKFTGFQNVWDAGNSGSPWGYDEGRFKDWMEVPPVNPYFAIDCDGKNVMTAYIEESMIDKSQTAMVQDGATCTVVIRNSTTDISIFTDDPIWLIDYTIHHGETNETEDANLEILTSHSYKEGSVTFQRIPKCFFDKLRIHNYSNLMLIYTDEAIKWLLKDNTGNSRCEDSNFIERYALVSMNFAMNTTKTETSKAFIRGGDQCSWLSITCNEGKVTEIKVRDAGLLGPIPRELALLSSLEALQLCKYIFNAK